MAAPLPDHATVVCPDCNGKAAKPKPEPGYAGPFECSGCRDSGVLTDAEGLPDRCPWCFAKDQGFEGAPDVPAGGYL